MNVVYHAARYCVNKNLLVLSVGSCHSSSCMHEVGMCAIHVQEDRTLSASHQPLATNHCLRIMMGIES